MLRAINKPIDASALFLEYGDWTLGTMQAGKVQISSRDEYQDSK